MKALVGALNQHIFPIHKQLPFDVHLNRVHSQFTSPLNFGEVHNALQTESFYYTTQLSSNLLKRTNGKRHGVIAAGTEKINISASWAIWSGSEYTLRSLPVCYLFGFHGGT